MRRALAGLAAMVVLSAAIAEGQQLQLPTGILALDGYPAPPLALEDINGNAFDLRQARGQWVFVHFWASWCVPCRREMPAIQSMAYVMEGAPLRIVLVNTAEDEDTIWSFLAAVAPELDTLMDRDGLVTEAWRPRGLPATYLVDPGGVVRYQALGGRPWNEPVYLDFLRKLITTGG